jgi:AcrR family transcriptional regulator
VTPASAGKPTVDRSPNAPVSPVGASGEASTAVDASAPRRPMRADARRNYDKIVATARIVFSERGADCSLDEIARRAGVGPGTLYRHFPTRDALVDALMRDWGDRVDADADAAVAADLPARETLRTWFDDFVDHITLHRGAAMKLCSAMDNPESPIYGKCQIMARANERVLGALAERGQLRADIDARDVMRLVTGVASVADQSQVEVDVHPMLDLVIDGIVKD